MPAQAAATVGPEEMESLGNILQRDQSAIVAVFDQVAVPMDELDTEEQTTRDEILTKVGCDIGNTLQKGPNVPFGIAVINDESIVGDAHGHLCGGGRD